MLDEISSEYQNARTIYEEAREADRAFDLLSSALAEFVANERTDSTTSSES